MKRAYYFWVTAILALAFGLLMFLAPGFAATQFQLTASPATDTLFRVAGAILIGGGVLNILVSRHPMSDTLKAVLWGNATVHGVGFVGDVWSAAAGSISWSGVAVGLIAHVVVFAGAVYYLMRPEAP
jgi:hypothetical protein